MIIRTIHLLEQVDTSTRYRFALADMDFPKPDEDILPDLFEHLDEQVEIVEQTLRQHFLIENRHGHEIVVFGAADKEDFLEALYENPETMVPFFMKITGLARRVFARVYGVDHIDQMKGWEQKDLRKTEKGQTMAEAVNELLPDKMYLETALFSFYKMWEADKRRTFRREYEAVILERLRDKGYPAKKDETIKGKPDIAIPATTPYEVLGEVRAIDIDDFQKRAKNFRDEATEAKQNYPRAYFVAVAEMPKHQLKRRREKLREGVEAGNIDLVVFQDEMDLLFDTLEEWGIRKQPQQTTFAEQTSDE